MKKLVFLFLLLGALAHSQGNRYEKIKAWKTAFITEQLGLTPTEAEKFWPVYNNFETQLHELRHRKKSDVHDKLESGTENLTDEEANKIIDEYMARESNQLELQKQKLSALRKVLSPQKIIGLKKAEDDFKHELLNRYRSGQEKKPANEGRKKP